MTVIAIRNNIVAVDRRSVLGNQYSTIDKLYTLDTPTISSQLRPVRSSEKVWIALAFCGPANTGIELMHWYISGADADYYPAVQKTEDWARLVVVTKLGIRTWEKGSGYPIIPRDDYAAYGSGSHFALGAMAAGAQAVSAVGAAMRHCLDIGGGIDYVTLVDGEEHGTQETAGG